VVELILIAQDLTYYGLDIYGERRLAELVTALSAVDGIQWIRLHYLFPTGFPEDVLDVIRENPKVCRYIDIPLQHIADNVLKTYATAIAIVVTCIIGTITTGVPPTPFFLCGMALVLLSMLMYNDVDRVLFRRSRVWLLKQARA